MKVVVAEWLKCKKATFELFMFIICNVIWYVADAYMLICITQALNEGDLKKGLITVAVFCMIRAGASMAQEWFEHDASYNCFESIHNRLTDKLLDSDYDMFTRFSVARVITLSQFSGDATTIGKRTAVSIVHVSRVIITLTSMYVIAGKIVIPIVGVHLLCILICNVMYKRYNKLDAERVAIMNERNQEFENVINGFAEVRAFGVRENKRRLIKDMNHRMNVICRKRTKVGMLVDLFIDIIGGVALLIVIGWSIINVNNGVITAATAMALVAFVGKLIDPVMSVINWLDDLSDSLKHSKEYHRMMTWENKTPEGHVQMDSFQSEIELDDVRFSYENTSSVLKGISMKIPRGSHIGICGKTGDGKSTLLKLLQKFYVASSGCILIDGVPLDEISDDSYRLHVGSVMQDVNIFPGTIMENVMFSNPHATEYEVVEACKKARLYDFICSLKDGFDTNVGPKGLKLSGGQKQRISLARLFLQNPEIIILDEATSALDNETESLVQDAISELKDKTIITVAHRLSTIRDCDCIFVMDNGRIAEYGSHESLMNCGGIYASMCKK